MSSLDLLTAARFYSAEFLSALSSPSCHLSRPPPLQITEKYALLHNRFFKGGNVLGGGREGGREEWGVGGMPRMEMTGRERKWREGGARSTISFPKFPGCPHRPFTVQDKESSACWAYSSLWHVSRPTLWCLCNGRAKRTWLGSGVCRCLWFCVGVEDAAFLRCRSYR